VNVLAFDTSGATCSAAVLRDGKIAASRSLAMERGHAQALAPMLRDVMAEAGLRFAALDLVGVTVGPGAFTGIRIGLAMARGIGLAARLPVFGVTTFAAIAAAAADIAPYEPARLVVLDSRRDDVFVQLFQPDGTALGEAASLPVAAVAAFLPEEELALAGDAAERVMATLDRHRHRLHLLDGTGQVDPATVARLAQRRAATGERPPPPAPCYLRAPDVSRPE
jgi:tRNA threonylcarbamoyladenosine biosynthesis protein TsaB